MKPLLNGRRSNSFRSSQADSAAASPPGDSPAASSSRSPAGAACAAAHGLCCLFFLFLGFRFSRTVFFLLFTAPPATIPSSLATADAVATELVLPTLPLRPPLAANRTASRVVVGRHGILVRPWPHPDPTEVMRAHRIMERVQAEQRPAAAGRRPRRVIAVTPTHVRTFQTLHITSLAHTLALLPYELTWVVVEAGGATNETAAILSRSGLHAVHVPFAHPMPSRWDLRHRLESHMRLLALRVIRERMLDGVVVFTDDSNVHNLEMFDEIQSVKWVGAMSVGILAQVSGSTSGSDGVREENLPIPVQGPACNSSGQLIGWHTFDSLPYKGQAAMYIGEGATVLPQKFEWAGFALNSRLLWKDAEGKPEWVKDLDSVGENGEEVDSPLALLKDASYIEPLGSCGKKVLLWWMRVEARSDSKFPHGWIIDPPLSITVPARRTPWPDAPPEPPSERSTAQTRIEKRSSKTSRPSRSKRGSRKKKYEQHLTDQQAASSQAEKQVK